MKILFNFASRSRPNKFYKTIENIIAMCESPNYEIVCTLDTDDKSMDVDVLWDWFNKKVPPVQIMWGESKNKIHAINRGIPFGEWDILVNVSDDMEFLVKGFDNIIREAFAGDLDKCLHFPDGNTTEIITMSILGRTYFNRFGYVYHPDYISLWADNEQTDVAKMLGKYVFIDKQIFSHNHPAFGKAATDAQYNHTESFFYIDKDTYDRRKQLNFDINV